MDVVALWMVLLLFKIIIADVMWRYIYIPHANKKRLNFNVRSSCLDVIIIGCSVITYISL